MSFDNTRKNIGDLVKLKPNWDSYNGSSISREAMRRAEYFCDLAEADRVSVPSAVVPCPSGAVQLEWKGAHEITFCTDGRIDIGFELVKSDAHLCQKIFNIARTMVEQLSP